MSPKRILYVVLGSICLALGCVGIALPILPTVPFFLATVFFYANSSQRLHDWFVNTKMYKKHLESFVLSGHKNILDAPGQLCTVGSRLHQ